MLWWLPPSLWSSRGLQSAWNNYRAGHLALYHQALGRVEAWGRSVSGNLHKGTATFPDWRLGSCSCCLSFFLKSIPEPPWPAFSSIALDHFLSTFQLEPGMGGALKGQRSFRVQLGAGSLAICLPPSSLHPCLLLLKQSPQPQEQLRRFT